MQENAKLCVYLTLTFQGTGKWYMYIYFIGTYIKTRLVQMTNIIIW